MAKKRRTKYSNSRKSRGIKRLNLDLTTEDSQALEYLTEKVKTRAEMIRKSIHILSAIKKGEITVHTKNTGELIPSSVILN